MKSLSNGHGALTIEDGICYAWRGDVNIGSATLPMTPEDAELFMEMCLSARPGDGTYEHGVTGGIWFRDLTKDLQ